METIYNNIPETAAEETSANVGAAEEVAEVKPYAFRRLCAEDMFLMLQIIKKIGIKEFKECFEDERVGVIIGKLFNKESGTNTAALYTLGGTIMLPALDTIIGNIPKCKEELYTLLADVSNMAKDDIRKMDAVLFVEMLTDFIKKPEFPGFIKVVSKSFR